MLQPSQFILVDAAVHAQAERKDRRVQPQVMPHFSLTPHVRCSCVVDMNFAFEFTFDLLDMPPVLI